MKKSVSSFWRFAAVAALVAQGTWAFAQDEDPFAKPGETPAATTAAPAQEDPFAKPGETAAAPTPTPEAPAPTTDSPFTAPTTDAPNPFTISAPKGPAPPFAPPDGAATPAGPMVAPAANALSSATIRENQEIRGLYVLYTAVGYQNPRQIADLARDFRDGHFTRAYMEIRILQGVAFLSQFEEALPSIGIAFPNPLRDLKANLGAEARIFAVVNLLPAYSTAGGSIPPPRNPAARFKELVGVDVYGKQDTTTNLLYLDPGNPLTARYLSAIISEIDTQVRPDGYLFTGLEYPGNEWGYNPDAVKLFRQTVGGEGNPAPDDPTWSAWRREQVTQLLRTLHDTVNTIHPGAPVSVLIKADTPPPTTWSEYIGSPTYAEHMQDWIGWGKDAIVDEIVFQVHERVAPQGNILRDWTAFAGNNSYSARPLVSIGGNLNFTQQFIRQLDIVRSRGLGTILFNYANPVRDPSRGFYDSLSNVFYKGSPGGKVIGTQLTMVPESRTFTRMGNPPPATRIGMQTPTPAMNILGDKPLVFATPTPVPTKAPPPTFVPEPIARNIKLGSGVTINVVVLEVTSTTVTIQEGTKAPMILSRSAIRSIEPPL
ncbi:hypothetical protein BH09SUM1_BH09SUM1_33030 [soil metagenome]